jgi:RHS repeat-associated protein
MLYLTKTTSSGTTSAPYYYILNLQGDVLYLVNTSGVAVASYTYDPYGSILSSTGSLANVNPLRYRGYYYDGESGFYYLQSRYYDPALGRFINADSYASTGQGFLGYNMFAYCGNNPCNKNDNSGYHENLVTTSIPLIEYSQTLYAGEFSVTINVSVEDNNVPIPIDFDLNENVSICSTSTVSDGFFSVSISDLGIELSNSISIDDKSVDLSYNLFTNTFSGSATFERDNFTYKVEISITGNDDFSSKERYLSNSLRCVAKNKAPLYALGLAVAIGVVEKLGGSLRFAKQVMK